MEKRKRNIQIKFRVTEEEKQLIEQKMAQLPTRQIGAYLRKMAFLRVVSIVWFVVIAIFYLTFLEFPLYLPHKWSQFHLRALQFDLY